MAHERERDQRSLSFVCLFLYLMPDQIHVTALIDNSEELQEREETAEGFISGSAVVTRVGVYDYPSTEMDLPGPPRMVQLFRTPETVFHQTTLDSLRLKPLTLRHPKNKFVFPDNYSEESVGTTGEKPMRFGSDAIAVNVMVTEKSAIRKVKKGRDKTSAGYVVQYKEESGEYNGRHYDYITDGPMFINHLGLVNKGRNDDEQFVRLLDEDENAENLSEEESEMNEEEIRALVEELMGEKLDDAKTEMKELIETGNASLKQELNESLVQSVQDGFKEQLETGFGEIKTSLSEEMNTLVQSEVAGLAHQEEEESTDEGNEEGEGEVIEQEASAEGQDADEGEEEEEDVIEQAEKVVADTEKVVAGADSEEELVKQRVELIVKATALLKGKDLYAMQNRDILIAAIGDSIDDADEQTDEYLYGVFDTMLSARDAASQQREEIRNTPSKRRGGGKGSTNGLIPTDVHDLKRRMRSNK